MTKLHQAFLWQQTFATIFSLANKLQVSGDKVLNKLTSRQLMTMIAMAHLNENETTIVNIARKMGTTKQNTKQLVNALEKKGYVTLVLSQTDKRAYNVNITESGQHVLKSSYTVGMTFFEAVFHEFSESELDILWHLLKKLYQFDGEVQDGFEADGRLL